MAEDTIALHIDTEEIDRVLDRLVTWDRKELLVKALKSGAEVFRAQTRQLFKTLMPTASAKMVSGVRIKSAIDDVYVAVNITGHPLNHIFELGTKERRLRKYHPAGDSAKSSGKTLRKTYKAGESRGAIKPVRFLDRSKGSLTETNAAVERRLKELLDQIIAKD